MRLLKSGIITAIISTTVLMGQGAWAAVSRYEVQSGTLSIDFYSFTTQIFESAGLTVTGLENTITPLFASQVGFNILP